MSGDAVATRLGSAPPLGGEKLPGPQQLDCECDRAMIEAWVFRAPLVATFLSVVIHRGFLLLRSPLDLAALIPERHVDQERVFESILDVPSVIYLNSHLRREQQQRWRLLFSSELHGHSFAQLCGRITHRGPCVLLLEDHDGQVFGGFASCSWEVKPQFQGETGSPPVPAAAQCSWSIGSRGCCLGTPEPPEGVSVRSLFFGSSTGFSGHDGEGRSRRCCFTWSRDCGSRARDTGQASPPWVSGEEVTPLLNPVGPGSGGGRAGITSARPVRWMALAPGPPLALDSPFPTGASVPRGLPFFSALVFRSWDFCWQFELPLRGFQCTGGKSLE